MKVRFLLFAVGFCLNAMAVTARSDDDVYQWLERMGAAMSQMHYQGTFVYLQGDAVETVRITHLVDEQGSHERLVSVSGVPREVVRDSAGVRWIAGEDRTVMADSAGSPQFFPTLPKDGIGEAASSYQFTLEDGQRIASRGTHRVDIKPHDEYRYGYRLWLEERSGLLLQWELVGSKGESLAKLMFTELKMGAEVDPDELHAPARDAPAPRSAPASAPEGRTVTSKPAWQALRLPPGFRLASHRKSHDAGQAAVYEHLVYSDGIAAVSVYVEPRDEKTELAQGMSSMGTTNALTRSVNGEVVTVLGDVPVATITMIGESVQPVSH
jgi:sigma-E factor negative regulatory protein RseB